MKFQLLCFLLLTLSCFGQDWNAGHWAGYPIQTTINNIGQSVLPIPDNSHYSIVIVSFLTTTNDTAILGDLRGTTITATFRLDATNNPILYYNNDTGYPGRYANVRLYFTTDTQPYYLPIVNANELQYWWTGAKWTNGWINLNSGNRTLAIPGTYTLTATIDSLQWSSAYGHFANDTNYTQAFLSAASRVAQIGFAFGGGSYFDIGIGVDNVNTDRTAAAYFTILNYSVINTNVPVNQPSNPTNLRVSSIIHNSTPPTP